MAEFKLKNNQAALILELSDNGEVNVDIAVNKGVSDAQDFAAAMCQAIAIKLVKDEKFQAEIMTQIAEDAGKDESL